jgi:hypothetical protein
MIGVLLGLLAVIGAGAWCVALLSLVQVVSLAPSGTRMATLFDMGWLKFNKIRANVGPAAAPHLRNYGLAFMAFFVVVIGIAAVAILLAASNENGASAAAAATGL